MSIYFKITPAGVYCYWSISYKTYSLRPLKNKTKPKKNQTKQNKTYSNEHQDIILMQKKEDV